jgi:hypothetical protein
MTETIPTNCGKWGVVSSFRPPPADGPPSGFSNSVTPRSHCVAWGIVAEQMMDGWWTRSRAWAAQSRERIERSTKAAVGFIDGHKVWRRISNRALGPLLFATLYRLDGALKCLSDCGSAPADGWTYEKGLNLPGVSPSENDPFPRMMSYQLSAETSGLSRTSSCRTCGICRCFRQRSFLPPW